MWHKNWFIIVRKTAKHVPNENSIIYSVPCRGTPGHPCRKSYYGETYRGIDIRLKEHIRDFNNRKPTSALVKHWMDTGHRPDFDNSKIIEKCPNNRTMQKLQECVHITVNTDNTNIQKSSHHISPILCQIIV